MIAVALGARRVGSSSGLTGFCAGSGLMAETPGVAPTGKAIVHWIGCINSIKNTFKQNSVNAIVCKLQVIYSTVRT